MDNRCRVDRRKPGPRGAPAPDAQPSRGIPSVLASALLVVLLGACATHTAPTATVPPALPSPSPASAVVSPTPAASPQPLTGGCASSTVFAGPAPVAASGSGLEGNPWLAATPASAGIYAILWSHRSPYLTAGSVTARDQSNGILWLSDRPATAALEIVAHPAGAQSPTVRLTLGGPIPDPQPGYPATIDLPSAGCWVLEVSIGARQGTIGLLVGAP
jgi:hypothetical protein